VVAARLEPLMEHGFIATCAVVDLEVLYSARNEQEYDRVLMERRSFTQAPITPAVTDRAIDVQRSLARTSQHRIPISDLLIAASAELAGYAVLHYDADFEQIAHVTGQPHEWVRPRGSL
jgi:predicted nucleic acid-binding protein